MMTRRAPSDPVCGQLRPRSWSALCLPLRVQWSQIRGLRPAKRVKYFRNCHFLAPLGAQGVTMSVRPFSPSLSRDLAIFIFLAQVSFMSLLGHS